MSEYRLSFCDLITVSDNITEIIVDNRIEVINDMILEFHAWLAKHHDDNFCVLINKKHHYSYSFDAQFEVGVIDKVKAIAVVVPDLKREIAARSTFTMGLRKDISFDIFYRREKAVTWLEEQLVAS